MNARAQPADANPPASRFPHAGAPDPGAMLESLRRSALASDPLSSVLSGLGVRAMIAGESKLSGAWGLRAPTGPGGFYAVLEGGMYLCAEDAGDVVHLSAGDVAFITRGDEHVIRSSPTARVRPVLDSFTAEDARHRRGLRVDAPGDVTRFLCGATILRHRELLDLAGGLPALIIVRRTDRTAPDALGSAAELVRSLCADHTPGTQAVLDHLVAVMLIETIRHHVRTHEHGGALLDRCIGPVLGLMHGEPGRAWTLAALANEAGLSRSAFAERFAAVVGEPPMSHLRACRMRHAAGLLGTTDDDVRHIARLVGYASEGAFCAAFKKWAGSTPEEYRRSATSPPLPDRPGTNGPSHDASW